MLNTIDQVISNFLYQYYLNMKSKLKYNDRNVQHLFLGLFWFVVVSCALEFILVEIIQHLSIRNVLGLAFILFELVFATITSYVSPGYVTDMKDEEDVEKTSLLNTSSKAPIQQGSKCKQCGVKRPLRSCHCTECDKCVVRFDHHDLFINNCIGYSNQHFYVCFLVCGIVASCSYFYSVVAAWNRLPLRLLIVLFSLFIALKLSYYVLHLRGMMPNIFQNLTLYESLNSYKIGYLKDNRFLFYNPFDHGIVANAVEFFHGSRNWMNTHYYCLLDIPDHPLRVDGLQLMQQTQAKTEIVTCPKCGVQLYRVKDAETMRCTCGNVFSV